VTKKSSRKVNKHIAEIELTNGYWARVDAKLLPLLMKYSWRSHKSLGKVYAKTQINGRTVYMHRFVMNATNASSEAGPVVDHRNGDSLDNRRANLRFATFRQNARNSRGAVGKRHSATRGVSKGGYPKRPWRAYIYVPKFKHLGWFATEKEARVTRLKAEKELFGEFAFQCRKAA
jgi:hypothetical protein